MNHEQTRVARTADLSANLLAHAKNAMRRVGRTTSIGASPNPNAKAVFRNFKQHAEKFLAGLDRHMQA